MNQARIREILLQARTDHDAVAAASLVSRRTLRRLCQPGWVAQPSTVKLVGEALATLYPPKPRAKR